MPKKAAKKTTKKTTAKKTTAKKTTAKKTTVEKTTTSKSGLHKRYLHNETQDFYAQHPNVKPLIILFMLVAAAVFIYLLKLNSAAAMY